MAGALSLYALYFVLTGAVSRIWKAPLILFFLFSIMLCKERSPMFLAAILMIINFIHPFAPRRTREEQVLDIMTASTIPFLIGVALMAGAFDRLLAVGLWDASSQSRFGAFSLMSYLTSAELWNGSGGSLQNVIAMSLTNNKNVESFFVIAVFTAGLPFAIVYTLSLIALYWRFMRNNIVFAILIVLPSFLSLIFVVKNSGPMALLLLGYYLWRRKQTSGMQSEPAQDNLTGV
jgi:hypothetical protein